MRRRDRQIADNEAKEILCREDYGFLATVSSDGLPYGVPLNYCYSDDAIYFHCAVEGRKLDNINFNNNVSFCVVGKADVIPSKFSTKYESVIASGKVYELTGVEKFNGLMKLVNKYSPGLEEKGRKYAEADAHKTRVYKIVPDSITGKSNE